VTAAAVRAAKAVNYQGAGTIEFIADASDGLKADRIWFMEMNTRLQVEHPVTEAITGVDLVEWQFRVAAGEPIPLAQADIPMNGWAMEARLYAEDPTNGFLPSIGKLDHLIMTRVPVRIDTGVQEGDQVSQFYDPMIAKIIAWGPDRDLAARDLAEACENIEVAPVRCNAGFLARCLRHPRFLDGDVDTDFLRVEADQLTLNAIPLPVQATAVLNAASTSFTSDQYSDVWTSSGGAHGLRLNASRRSGYRVWVSGDAVVGDAYVPNWNSPNWRERLDWQVTVGDRSWTARDEQMLIRFSDGEYVGLTSEEPPTLFYRGDAFTLQRSVTFGATGGAPASDGSLRAPMPGKIVAAPAMAGDTVAKGAPIVVLEAMKMEHALIAPFDGVVESVSVTVGEQVGDGVVLAVVRAAEA
ncbi:MAG: biotin/lipoyl-containing protein, partial [Brevundimonas sp.]|nr:biotin/lipoyl-containing protein [Brevundimonas sp.]